MALLSTETIFGKVEKEIEVIKHDYKFIDRIAKLYVLSIFMVTTTFKYFKTNLD